jgi:hypothetical protein
VKGIVSKYRSHLSTVFGAIVAVATAWQSIDWDNFELNASTIIKLFLSGVIALGGYMTSINIKSSENNINQ